MTTEITKLRKLRPVGAGRFRLRFAGERRDHLVDLTGLLARSEHFAPLRADARSFAAAKIVEGGLGIAWPLATRWGRLDLSAATLQRIAEEQEPMTGDDFGAWRTRLGLSLSEAAKLLGLSRRTIMGYLKKDELPVVLAIACRALARDQHVLAAHYVPTRKAAGKAA